MTARQALIAVATLGAALALPLFASSPAVAAPDPADGVVIYTGIATDNSSSGIQLGADIVAGADCRTGPCLLFIDITYQGDSVDILRDTRVELTNGHARVELNAEGSVCDNDYRPRGVLTVDLTADTFTFDYPYEATGVIDCPDGSTVESEGGVGSATIPLSSGDPCVLFGTCATPSPSPSAEARPPFSTGGSAPRPFTQPTVLGDLPTAATAITLPNVIWAATGTVVLVLLLALPTYFFNSAAEAASDRLGAWWRRKRGRSDDIPAPRTSSTFTGWPIAACGVLIAGIIAAFADPDFGFDGAGLRILVSILISFAIEVILGWVAVIWLVRRTHPTAVASVRFAPLTLFVVLAAVVLTRLTHFEPAIVFGLVAGVAFGGLLATAEKARVALIGLGWSFAVGFLAWIGYSIVSGAAGGHPNDVQVFVGELLSAASIAGISAIPIALMPIRGLAGHVVWSWNRLIWAVSYAIGLFAFLLVLLPLPSSWQSIGIGIWTWVALYLGYAVGAVGIWLAVTRPWKREPVG